jgi:hypothetical protein
VGESVEGTFSDAHWDADAEKGKMIVAGGSKVIVEAKCGRRKMPRARGNTGHIGWTGYRKSMDRDRRRRACDRKTKTSL